MRIVEQLLTLYLTCIFFFFRAGSLLVCRALSLNAILKMTKSRATRRQKEQDQYGADFVLHLQYYFCFHVARY